MTHEARTADEIERDIRQERAQMSDSINSLQQKFSVDAIAHDIGSMFRAQGGDIGHAVTRTVARNPAAVALVGVGLAWLFLGQNRGADGAYKDDGPDRGTRGHGAEVQRQGPTIRSGNAANGHPDRHWFDHGQTARGSEDQSGIAGKLRDVVAEAASNVGDAASDLTERLSHGLEDLSEDARSRVLAARRAAHDARDAAGDIPARGRRAAAGFFEAQPLVVGALAVAFGAALGGALPHSRIEDDTMGDSSDRLFAEAQAMLYAERDKAMAAARTAAAEVRHEIGEAKSDLAKLLPEDKSVGEVIVDRAADAAARVYDHTAEAAGRQADKPTS